MNRIRKPGFADTSHWAARPVHVGHDDVGQQQIDRGRVVRKISIAPRGVVASMT
jgi:hypothetical protein